MLQGSSELEQISKICSLLGTPSDRNWQGFSQLPYTKKFKSELSLSYNHSSKLHLLFESKLSEEGYYLDISTNQFFPHFILGINLLSNLLLYDPFKRLSAKNAMQHSYFYEKPLPKDERLMPTFPTLHTTVSKNYFDN